MEWKRLKRECTTIHPKPVMLQSDEQPVWECNRPSVFHAASRKKGKKSDYILITKNEYK